MATYPTSVRQMIAAGWSDDAVAAQVLALLRVWFDVLEEVAREAQRRFGPLGPGDLAMFVGLAFLGGESLILLGDAAWASRVRQALHGVTDLIRTAEENAETSIRPAR